MHVLEERFPSWRETRQLIRVLAALRWPASVARVLGALWLLALIVFVPFAVAAHQTVAFPFDVPVSTFVQHLRGTPFAAWVRPAGDLQWYVPTAIAYVLILGTLLLLRLYLEALCVAISSACTDLINVILNTVVARPRPHGVRIPTVAGTLGQQSFPSGHVAHTVGLYVPVFLLCLLIGRARPHLRPVLLVLQAICVYFLALVGVSRVLEGQHWPSDVLGGYLIGGLIVSLAILLYRNLARHALAHQAAAHRARAPRPPAWHPHPHEAVEEDLAGLADLREEAIGAEEPVAQEVARGRAVETVYVALLVLAALAFAALAVSVRGADILRFDLPVERAVQSVHLPVLTWVLIHTSDLGWFPGNLIAYALVFVGLWLLRLRLEAILAVGFSLLAGGVGEAIKLAVGRTRPTATAVHVAAPLTDPSFPSGHVIQYVTIFGFAFYVVATVWRAGWARSALLVVLGLLIVLIGPSRVYLGQHWPSDVLGAYLYAGIWLAGMIALHLALVRHLASGGTTNLAQWRQRLLGGRGANLPPGAGAMP